MDFQAGEWIVESSRWRIRNASRRQCGIIQEESIRLTQEALANAWPKEQTQVEWSPVDEKTSRIVGLNIEKSRSRTTKKVSLHTARLIAKSRSHVQCQKTA